MDPRELTRDLVVLLSLERDFCANEYGSLPWGHLDICQDGKYVKYQHYYKHGGKYIRRGIKKKPLLVRQLARKRFLQEKIGRLDHNIALLQTAAVKMHGLSSAAIIDSLPKGLKGLPSEFFRRDMGLRPQPSRDPNVFAREFPRSLSDYPKDSDGSDLSPSTWATLPYAENTGYLENKTVPAENGLLTRSKSEADYADFYDKTGILYHYDETFFFMEGESDRRFGRVRYISPDFVLLRPDGTFLFHEHFGRTDDPKYMRDNIRKIMTYIELGIMPGRDLLISFERPGGGVDLKLLQAQLNCQYYLK